MGNQNPHNAPPALPLGNQGTIGYKYGLQSAEHWNAGESDNRQICDARLAVHMWRLSVFTSQHVSINVEFGSSRARQFRALRGPLVMYVPGQVVVYAQPTPLDDGSFVAGFAMCTLTAVNSGQQSSARLLRTAAGALPDDAARYVPLVASVLTIDGNVVNLNPTQTIALIAGATLTSGLGYLEFDT